MKKVKRPWGFFKILEQAPTYWVKKLVIKPQQKLSEQYHKFRKEEWYILEGQGEITYQNTIKPTKKGDKWHIGEFTIHRIKNTGKKDLTIIEIATGNPKEEDIIRLEDSYGRKVERF